MVYQKINASIKVVDLTPPPPPPRSNLPRCTVAGAAKGGRVSTTAAGK